MEEGIDFVVCAICKNQFRRITNSHLRDKHQMIMDTYRCRYPNALTISKKSSKKSQKSTCDAISRGLIHNEDQKRKQSESMKIAWATYPSYGDEFRKKESIATKKRWANGSLGTKSHRKKISKGLKRAHKRGCYEGETRQKQSEAKIKSWARGDYKDMYTLEYKERRSGIMSKIWENPQTKEKASKSRKKLWADGTYDGVFTSPSKPELATEVILKELNLPYTIQYRIPADGTTYTVDFLIGANLILEVFGTYWHGPDRPEQQMRDEKRLDWLEENGFDTLVLWEHEINEDPQLCADIIKNHAEEFSIYAR